MKVLIFGLPGSGKTTLARKTVEVLKSEGISCTHINADEVRALYNDWDFSEEGRIRQAKRMKDLTEACDSDVTIADFVCPYNSLRLEFGADLLVHMNTIDRGRFENTNAVYEKPTMARLEFDSFSTDSDEGNGDDRNHSILVEHIRFMLGRGF
jgi:adenylylsulfate kinase